jgi:hypothetical protein
VVAALGPNLILSNVLVESGVRLPVGRLFGKFEQVRGRTARFTLDRIIMSLPILRQRPGCCRLQELLMQGSDGAIYLRGLGGLSFSYSNKEAPNFHA